MKTMGEIVKEVANLDTKAYRLGYRAGLDGEPLSEDDYSSEGFPSFSRGHEHGTMEREISTPKK